MKLAVITGGCRRLGAAISARLAEEGYALALHASSNAEPKDDLAKMLGETGVDWQGFAADLSDAEETEKLIPQIAKHFGEPPTLLVNSAALFGDDRPETVDANALLDHYAINCAAPALLAKQFAAAAGGGSIVNIVDQRISHPHGDQFSYTLSKIALSGLTELLARELAPAIRVNAVAPGLTIPTSDYDEDQMSRVRAALPLERLPQPRQVADAVAWLAAAEATTGQTIFVDGGAHLESYDRDFLHLN